MANLRALPSSLAQLLRSAQKDEQYLRVISNDFNRLFQKLFGIQKWISFREELESLSQLIYYLMTTLSSLQTLGEEYVNIVQISGKSRLLMPSMSRRVIMTVLQTFGYLALNKTLTKLVNILENSDKPYLLSRNKSELIKVLKSSTNWLTFAQSVHMVLFYFSSDYYHLSKRLTSVRYIRLDEPSVSGQSEQTSERIYKFIAYLTLSQLCVSIIIQYLSSKSKLLETSTYDNRIDRKSMDRNTTNSCHKCALCLEMRDNSTLTLCGHVFCWNCITEWLQIRSECPLCRQKLHFSRLVFLNNYF